MGNGKRIKWIYLLILPLILLPFQNCGAPKSASNITNGGSTGGSTGTTTMPMANPGGAPIAPAQLQAVSPSSAQINLTWKDNSSNETGFKIERASAIAGPFVSGMGAFSVIVTTSPNATSYSDLNLQPASTYYYRVSAVNGGTSSAPTSEVTVVTMAAPTSPPSPPSNLTATATAATLVSLQWNDNSINESYFKIERSTDGGTTFAIAGTTSANVNSFTDINLNPGTNYTYRVRASNSLGDSTNTANASATTLAAGNMNTYAYVSVNIIGPNCTGCHGNAYAAGGVNLASYNGVSGIVNKGNSASSLLYTDITGGRMPPGGGITATQLGAIKGWIDSGGANN